MRAQHWISIGAIAWSSLLGLQAATFAYVLKVEERLTRLETIAAISQLQMGLAARRGVQLGGTLAPIAPAAASSAHVQPFAPAQ